MFLTYGYLSQHKLWENYIENPNYNIYIHNKNHYMLNGKKKAFPIDIGKNQERMTI